MNLFDDVTASEPPQVLAEKIDEPTTTDFSQPLAARLRPRDWDEYAGQSHLVGPNAPLRRAIDADRLPSCLLYGPPGTGKTTLARLIAGKTRAHFEPFSAVTGNVAEVRRIVEAARQRRQIAHTKASPSTCRVEGRTILFVDEIHRFNRAQQDAFLPHVEDGTIVLIGATTENPLASVNSPLLSRCRLFRLELLETPELVALLERALHDERGLQARHLKVEANVLGHLARSSAGDARAALNALEMTADLVGDGENLTLELAERAVQKRAAHYDNGGDEHYDMISAYIKALRGGAPDAALFWMAQMLEGGEDAVFIARRLIIQASEDVGNADPRALQVALNALQAIEKVGLPEAAIPLAQATIYVATAPKSNASYLALKRAQDAVRHGPPARVPPHLRSTALRGAREREGAGAGYIYPHDAPGNFAPQEYVSPALAQTFYEPTENGYESSIARRLQHWWGATETDELKKEAIMDLRIRTSQNDGITTVELGGELELHNAPSLREEFGRVCETNAPCVLVDLSQVSFIDSTGIGVLVGGLKRAREHDGTFVLVCPVPRLRRVFEITGLLRALPLYETREEARAACAPTSDTTPSSATNGNGETSKIPAAPAQTAPASSA